MEGIDLIASPLMSLIIGCVNSSSPNQFKATEILAVVAHGIWLDSNGYCFEGKKLEHQLIISKAISVLKAYQL